MRLKPCATCSKIQPIQAGTKRCQDCITLGRTTYSLRRRRATRKIAQALRGHGGRGGPYFVDGHGVISSTAPPKPRIWVAGSCVRCADPFVIVDQLESRYCSASCLRADGKDRRRARKREAFVAPVYRSRIFDRDAWMCQLCGKRTSPGRVVPHPLAPVLDHIVPLADGGTHEPKNVQCAHFLCNSQKADRGQDQLRLIG